MANNEVVNGAGGTDPRFARAISTKVNAAGEERTIACKRCQGTGLHPSDRVVYMGLPGTCYDCAGQGWYTPAEYAAVKAERKAAREAERVRFERSDVVAGLRKRFAGARFEFRVACRVAVFVADAAGPVSTAAVAEHIGVDAKAAMAGLLQLHALVVPAWDGARPVGWVVRDGAVTPFVRRTAAR